MAELDRWRRFSYPGSVAGQYFAVTLGVQAFQSIVQFAFLAINSNGPKCSGASFKR